MKRPAKEMTGSGAIRMGTRRHDAGDGKELRAEIPAFSCDAELALKLAAAGEGDNAVVQA